MLPARPAPTPAHTSSSRSTPDTAAQCGSARRAGRTARQPAATSRRCACRLGGPDRDWMAAGGAQGLKSAEPAPARRAGAIAQLDPLRGAPGAAARDGDLGQPVDELRADGALLRPRGQRDRAPERAVRPLAHEEAVLPGGAELGEPLVRDREDALRERDLDVLRVHAGELDPDDE